MNFPPPQSVISEIFGSMRLRGPSLLPMANFDFYVCETDVWTGQILPMERALSQHK